jgi:hypothetical protein
MRTSLCWEDMQDRSQVHRKGVARYRRSRVVSRRLIRLETQTLAGEAHYVFPDMYPVSLANAEYSIFAYRSVGAVFSKPGSPIRIFIPFRIRWWGNLSLSRRQASRMLDQT